MNYHALDKFEEKLLAYNYHYSLVFSNKNYKTIRIHDDKENIMVFNFKTREIKTSKNLPKYMEDNLTKLIFEFVSEVEDH